MNPDPDFLAMLLFAFAALVSENQRFTTKLLTERATAKLEERVR